MTNDKIKYNPQIHHRKSIRLKGYDYSNDGAYFITICCHEMKCKFGSIENEEMIYNEFGLIAHNEWMKLTERFPNIKLDIFQIMPNHMHGILLINAGNARAGDGRAGDGRAGFTPALASADASLGAGVNPARTTPAPTPTLGNIMGAYKSLVANACLDIFKSKNKHLGKLWHRDYYDHIIRSEQEYQRISEYIFNNPKNWNADKFFK